MSAEPILISVVIPAFNAAEYLPAAVENIRRQHQANVEIIVVDDGSTDDSQAVAAGLGVRYFRQENSGPAAARNAGLKLAQGEFVAFLDADDLWPEGSLQVRLDCLKTHPEIDIALGKVQCLRAAESQKSTSTVEPAVELSDPFVSFNIGAALYRKTVFEKNGTFDPELRFGEDTDWFMRAREASVGLLVLAPTTLHYRLHAGGMTHGKSAADLNMVRVLKRSLDRRRQQSTQAAPASLPNLQKEAAE